ncbi:hypothetical protein ACFVJM_31130 [Streptomyces virginiae]|uniref:hypothetical protein n=1 Tax=Streptomyces virginiae TaxID=1961 RepID=UPI0036338721
MPAFVLAVADSSSTVPPAICRSAAEISNAWRWLRRAARHQAGVADLVIQEHLSGQQYVVHTSSGPASQHVVMGVWAERRTFNHVHARSDLMTSNSQVVRSMSLYVGRALDALGVKVGPARCRMVCTAGRGPTLLSARAFAQPSLAADRLIAGRGAAEQSESLFVSRVSLIAPGDGILDAHLLRTVTTLPTVSHTIGSLVAGAAVRKTVDRSSSPGELVLSATSRAAIEEDYRVIRAVETLGLYEGATL